MPRHSSTSVPRPKWVAGVLAVALAVAGIAVGPVAAAQAADTAGMTIQKSASTATVTEGTTFNWQIQVGCSVLEQECINASVSDAIPSQLIVGDAGSISLTPPVPADVTVVGQQVTVAFTGALANPVGAHGLGNEIVTITVPVTVRSDLPYTPTPIQLTNTAVADADNTSPKSASADVELAVPLHVTTSASKSFEPASLLGVTGAATTVKVGGTNTSNSVVDTFTIQDPQDPAAGGIFASTLRVDGLGAVTWPAGAVSATVSAWDASVPGWVSAPSIAVGTTPTLPSGVAAADIRGVRIVFSSGATPGMATGETASFDLATTLRSAGSGARSNTSTSTVSVDGVSATDPHTATLTLVAATSSVAAGKSITPERIATVAYGGQDLTSAAVELTARNSGTVPLTELTIAEPADPASLAATNPLAPAHTGGGLIFDGFGSLVWPAGATSAEIAYHYDDGTTSGGTVTGTAPGGSPLTPPTAGKRVTGFQLTFRGAAIPPSAQATVPFAVDANPLQTAPDLRVDYLNQIQVGGVDAYLQPVAPATASDTVTVFADQLSLTTAKQLTATTLSALPGQRTTATLSTTVAPYPQSTRTATTIIQYDPPAGTAALTEWYRYFDPTEIVLTSVPSGATLSVEYLQSDLTTWTPIPALTGLTGGPLTVSIPTATRDAIHGLRLIWDSPSAQFTPGQTIVANIGYALRSTLRDTGTPLPNANLANTLVNCASASGANGGFTASASAPTCPDVDLVAVDLAPGTGPGTLTKQFRVLNGNSLTGTGQDLINTRASARTGVRLGWSTGGTNGVQSMTVSDAALSAGAVDPAAYAFGMYDAFDLYRINSLDSSDAAFQYDRVAIQAFNKNTLVWETPAGISCTVAAPCTSFTGYTLTTAQRAAYVGVRFVFTERPGRTTINPAPGSGVAATTTARNIDLVYELRDTLRSDASIPVVNGYEYNIAMSGGQSVVLNEAHTSAVLESMTLTRTASDTIQLQNVPPAVDTTKTWSGGPVPLPASSGQTPPTTRVTLATRNITSGTTMSRLTVVEPDPTQPSDTPFSAFDLQRFVSVSHPAGATTLTIEVRDVTSAVILTATGTPAAATTAALAWTAVQLAPATSVSLVYGGRMAVNETATVVLDLVLRETLRGTSTPVAVGTVYNGTRGTVGDLRFVGADPANPTPADFAIAAAEDSATASVQLVASTIAVTAAKSFSPATQTEPTRTPIAMTISGTPGGSQRTASVTLTDDRSSFWNAFDFESKGAITLPTFSSSGGLARIQVEACVGGAFDATAIAAAPAAGCTDRGGSWVGAGTWLTQSQLTAGSFLPALPGGMTAADVTGLRVTVERSDGAQWENPSAPVVSITVNVQRRETLRSGGAVPSDYAENSPAPGETVAGTTTNAVRAEVLGIWGASASDSTTAAYRYVHQTTSVQVSKLPSGVRSPGTVIPYTLTMLNTGQRPIVNPVVTDVLPTDASGAMLIFNPDAVTSYTLAVSGGSVPSGSLPIPTGAFTGTTPGVITIDASTDAVGPTSIAFAFPSGTVLGVGQTLTISVPLMFRPGLVNATPVANTFEIRGDRVFDACTAPAGAAATATSAGYGCTTGTTVTLAQAPALRAYISSKAIATPGIDYPGSADADSQYAGASNETCRAEREADDFSRPPCAPKTILGQDSAWRLTIQNTGTTDVSRLVVATRLPNVGDQTIVSGLVRNSQWVAAFTGQITTAFGPGTTATTYYTTNPEPCEAVLASVTNTSACGDLPATGWTPLPVGGLPDPTVITGLQFVVDFPSGDRFSPAEIVTVDLGTTTVAGLPVLEGSAGANPLAVNSLSVSGMSVAGVVSTRISALDYSRALLSLASGSVTLTKEVTGPASSFIPDGTVFSGQLVCTTDAGDLTRDFEFTRTGGVVSPATIQFDDLPGGAECDVVEADASGQTTATSDPVVVDPLASPADLPSISLVNDYQLTELEVRKTVTIDPDGTPPTGFAFEVVCTFLGEEIELDPEDAVFALDAGGSRTITGLPVNAECVVTETDNRGAGLTVVAGQTTAPGTVTEDQEARSVTITGLQPQPDPPAASVNLVTVDNRFDATGVVFVEKAFAGGAAEQFGFDADPAKTFTIHVVCTYGSDVQFEGDIALTAANGWSEPIAEPMVDGTVCRFTEPALGGADAVVFSPADAGPPVPDVPTGIVTVPGEDGVATVTATNWYLTGSLEVTKVWTGDEGAIDKFGIDPALEYEFALVCTRDGVEVALPGGSTRTVTSDAPVAQYTGIAAGADCVLSETESNGAYAWRVVDGDGDEVDGGQFTVALDPEILSEDDQVLDPLDVENEFRFAAVSVSKVVDVSRSDGGAAGPFEVELVCTLDGRPIEALEPSVRTIDADETIVWTELAAGADCVVTETDRGGSASTATRLGAVDGTLGVAVLGDSVELAPLRPTGEAFAPNRVVVVNSYPLASTGSTDRLWLLAPAGLLVLAGLAGVAAGATMPGRRRRRA